VSSGLGSPIGALNHRHHIRARRVEHSARGKEETRGTVARPFSFTLLDLCENPVGVPDSVILRPASIDQFQTDGLGDSADFGGRYVHQQGDSRDCNTSLRFLVAGDARPHLAGFLVQPITHDAPDFGAD
jgi:hypothetical protein